MGGGRKTITFHKLCNPRNIRRYLNEQELFQSATQKNAVQETREVKDPLTSRNGITPLTC